MAEIATVNNGWQLGVESTPGTAVAVAKRIQSFDYTPGIKFTSKTFRALGKKFGSQVIPGREWMELKLSGNPTYGELPYILCNGLVNVTATSDGTLPKLWTFTPALSTEDSVKTYTVEHGSAARARKWSYHLLNEIGFKFTREGVEVDGTAFAQQITEGASWTTGGVTDADTAPVPIAGSSITVTLADTWAGLTGASVVQKVIEAEWRISDRYSQFWYLDSSKTSFAGHVEAAPKATLKLMMEADSNGAAMLTTMRAGSTKFCRISCSGANIETAKPWLFQIDTAFQVTQPSEYKDQDGVYALEWTGDMVWDGTASKATEVTVRNKLATL